MKKSYEAGQRPTTGRWFLLDYSLPHYQIRSWTIVFPSSFIINFIINSVYLTYISKFGWENLIYNSFSREFTMTCFVSNKVPKCTPSILMEMWPYHLPCFISSFLYDPACKAWLFEKFIFELEVSYSFKITCILVRQVILLRKLVVSSAKFIL